MINGVEKGGKQFLNDVLQARLHRYVNLTTIELPFLAYRGACERTEFPVNCTDRDVEVQVEGFSSAFHCNLTTQPTQSIFQQFSLRKFGVESGMENREQSSSFIIEEITA